MAITKSVILQKNGEENIQYTIYSCNDCRTKVEEAWPRYQTKEVVLCLECAYKKSLINDDFYLRHSGLNPDKFRVGINQKNEIEVWTGKRKAPWLRTVKELRRSQVYHSWRSAIYERDDYTCQECGKRGGELNAHHIKSFKDYPKLRTNVENGVTLCVECHKKKHRK